MTGEEGNTCDKEGRFKYKRAGTAAVKEDISMGGGLEGTYFGVI